MPNLGNKGISRKGNREYALKRKKKPLRKGTRNLLYKKRKEHPLRRGTGNLLKRETSFHFKTDSKQKGLFLDFL